MSLFNNFTLPLSYRISVRFASPCSFCNCHCVECPKMDCVVYLYLQTTQLCFVWFVVERFIARIFFQWYINELCGHFYRSYPNVS